MSGRQKHVISKNTIKNIVIDQLLVSEPASLNFDTILKGVQCKFGNYPRSELLTILDDMYINHELLKLVDAESGIRFKLASTQNPVIDWEV